ncbi:superfamily II DNA or RNA helicase [Arcanobacterium wilhelmae]|uniref:Superfamily II DNA or RNA helicase n=1 Tax=Arcanobacterium wilhelmae TaxID=1803177 RepID=A0ABT9NBG3_9ACTO|nr:DEAD/DEAH box helicase family protein [Arcanobacterium wilhelmae]MDP9801059.1 superfamily II DNA or RNA helicase [Arcanobacterium wilhelmae]WFN90415.1 DEAD/DEAH box helicase family protein [Arcanobacterium wilhelmae]
MGNTNAQADYVRSLLGSETPEGSIGSSAVFGFLNRAFAPRSELFNPTLIANTNDRTVKNALLAELNSSDSFIWSVAFVTEAAVAMLKEALLEYEGTGEVITSTYLGFNEPAVFAELLNLPNVTVRIFDPDQPFHAKGYIFRHPSYVTAIIGSSNLTDRALVTTREWNLKFSAAPGGQIVHDLEAEIAAQRTHSILLTTEWIEEYRANRQVARIVTLANTDEALEHRGKIVPNAMQAEALDNIQKVWDAGEKRAVVISATGTGKTILAALAVRQAAPARFLFVVHREQIVDRAIEEFQRVLEAPASQFGKLGGGHDTSNRQYVFATIQSLSRPDTLARFSPDAFDFIVIDEVHRAGADSYTRVVDHFRPRHLLGLTATPERSDDFNIFELFDYNVPYEIRLQAALEANMLAPFHYYGIHDYVTADGEMIEAESPLARLTSAERVHHIVNTLEEYGRTENVKGLMFCSRVDEALELEQLLNQQTVFGRQLRVKALPGASTSAERETAVAQLANGELDYILTVDIFNEGVDIPQVNQVVMLRATQSAIVFTQQLGRGLRKAPAKITCA